jgi:signal transduction histidine kinase/CheY-like chemotaxis protein
MGPVRPARYIQNPLTRLGAAGELLRGLTIGVLCIGVALLVRFALDPLLGDRAPFVLPLCAVAATAWFGGLAPALMALVLGYCGAQWYFVAPRGVLTLGAYPDLLGALTYAATGLVVAFVLAGLRRAQDADRARAQALGREAAERAQLAAELEHALEGRRAAAHEREELLEQLAEERERLQRSATEREELLAAAQRARAQAEAAAELSRRLQAITDAALGDLSMQDLLAELLQRIAAALAVERGVVLLHEPGSDSLVVRAATRGFEHEVRSEVRVPVGKGFAGRIAIERRPLVIEDIAEAEVVNPFLRQEGIRSLLGVPLLVEGRVLGVLDVGSSEPRRFLQNDITLMQLVADRVALAIDRVRIYEAERRARQAAEAADRAKDEFLAMLGHELRNPLSAVRNALVVAGLDEGRRGRALDIARRQTDQLVRLVDDLLDMARITQQRITLRKETLVLASVLEKAIEATRPLIEEREHRLALSLPSATVCVAGDAARLEQVVVNLLTNAVKYTPPGGKIDVSAAAEGEQAVIRVRDTGIGIAPDMLPRVFDLFAQAEQGLERAEGGLGIGLTLVRRLVEMHGGTVEAASGGLGNGAEFVIRLPALPGVEATVKPSQVPERGTTRVRVLLVDDNADAAESLRVLLELLGHQVRTVHDGPSALDALRGQPFDVAVIDIGLPGMDGYEVARRTLRLLGGRRPVLIALTGYGRREDREAALAAGFDHHLVKPIDPEALQGMLSGVRLDEERGKSATVH